MGEVMVDETEWGLMKWNGGWWSKLGKQFFNF